MTAAERVRRCRERAKNGTAMLTVKVPLERSREILLGAGSCMGRS
jgi:hypothetical protein